jgi:glycopeptide antibiotics resistance protein
MKVMILLRIMLLISPYILIPLLLAYYSKRWKVMARWTTYLLTAFLIFLYPLLLFWIDRTRSNRPVKCLNPEFAVFAGNLIIMVPVGLLLQFLFNRVIKTDRKNIT